MNISFFYNKYLIFLLAFFSPMIISIGGEISPSFLFILGTAPLWYKYLNVKKDRLLQKFIKPFLIILIVQALWIPFAHTDLFIQIKGILITLSGLFHFAYYYLVYKHNPQVIKWGILGTFLSSFIFTNILAEIAGGEFGLWKFQIFPRIILGILSLYIWFCHKKWILHIAPFVLIGVGALGLATGARSAGLIPFMTGIIIFVLQLNKTIKTNQIKKYLITGGIIFYGAYVFIYVPGVINGSITGGNTHQLKNIDNPYNPLNLIMMGRTDSVIPFIAFLDKPFTGWGFFTKDPQGKYHRIENKLINNERKSDSSSYAQANIPGHSVLGYYACSYGIIVLISLLVLIGKTWKFLYYSLLIHDKYLLYRVYCTISITWNFLFSPIAHFKWLPSTMALIVVFSTISYKRYQRYRKLTSKKVTLAQLHISPLDLKTQN